MLGLAGGRGNNNKIFKKLIAVNSRQIQLAMGGSSSDAISLGEVGISMLFGGRCC